MLSCHIFILVSLSLTALCVFLGRNRSFQTVAFVMFLPALMSSFFVERDFWKQVLGYNKVELAARYSITGGLLVLIIIAVIVVFVSLTGWGVVEDRYRGSPPDNASGLFGGFVRAAGEEIGWRCYLLPCLLNHYPKLQAFLISGVVWGLFHVPVMVLLSYKLKPKRPVVTVLVQFLHVILSAFPHGWLAMKSEFSMWAPTMMHFVWNRINPVILGSIYTQQRGQVKGEQWLINGEGLAGCIVLSPVAAYIMWKVLEP